jgi:hypothetical protein
MLLVLGCLGAVGVLGYRIANRAPAGPGQRSPAGSRANDPIAELEKVDPKLIVASESGRLKTGLKELRGIAVGPGDRLHLAGDQALVVLAPDGAPVSRTELGAPAFCLAVDEAGTSYVGLRDRIEAVGPKGERSSWPALGKDAWITSVAIAGDHVAVGDFGNRAVIRFDRSGREVGRVVPGGTDVVGGRFFVPSPYFDLAGDGTGGLWVTHTGRLAIENYGADGALASTWGSQGNDIARFSGCCNPTHIALRKDGTFVTSEKGLVRIKLMSPKGDLLGVIATPKDFPKGLTGLDVAVDTKDRILVTDPSTSCVRVYILKV